MRRYFPHVEIVWQRIAGVPKSMTAIKHCNSNDGTAVEADTAGRRHLML